ncbi:MAG: hypothetical protein MR562_06745 [Clostridiaceae bacterium]|nr:hypothetical protein [Clostridiaceae bacterium]
MDRIDRLVKKLQNMNRGNEIEDMFDIELEVYGLEAVREIYGEEYTDKRTAGITHQVR